MVTTTISMAMIQAEPGQDGGLPGQLARLGDLVKPFDQLRFAWRLELGIRGVLADLMAPSPPDPPGPG
jgi:hypothetical protein